MKAVAYVRVSTEEQVQGTSLDTQAKACIEYAQQNNISLPLSNIFREEGVSAKIIDRPQLARLLEYCTKYKGTITHCIVWKVDRLARKSEYHHVIKAALAKQGVKLVSVTEPIGDDPIGNLMDGVLASFAQFDNDIRTLRTTGGMRARTAEGGWPHDAPYGYKKARTATGKSTIEPAEQAPIAKKFLEEFSTGAYTVKEAVNLAYSLGIRTTVGKKRSWQSIKNILTNPLYMGYVRSKYTDGQIIKGLHVGIIEEKTYYRNQAILDGNSKNYSRRAEPDWPLRGGFMKHTCGKPMTGSAPRGRNGPSPRYSCPVCKGRDIGRAVSRQKEQVHDDFLKLMQAVRPKPGVQRLFKEVVLRQWNNEFKDLLQHTQKIEEELSALQKKKSRIIDLFIDEKLTEAEKTAKLAEVESQAGSLKLQKVEATHYVAEKEQIIDGALLFMSDPGLFWNQGSIEIKKRVQDVIFPEGLTYDCEDGFGTAKLSESYLLINEIAQKGDSNNIMVAATGIEPVTLGL